MPRKEEKRRPNYGILDVRYSFSRTTPLFWICVFAVILAIFGLFFKFLRPFSFMASAVVIIYLIFGLIVLWEMINYLKDYIEWLN